MLRNLGLSYAVLGQGASLPKSAPQLPPPACVRQRDPPPPHTHHTHRHCVCVCVCVCVTYTYAHKAQDREAESEMQAEATEDRTELEGGQHYSSWYSTDQQRSAACARTSRPFSRSKTCPGRTPAAYAAALSTAWTTAPPIILLVVPCYCKHNARQ